MQRGNLAPVRHPVRLPPKSGRWLDELDEPERCLSCSAPVTDDELFCRDCRSWSRQSELSDWDDIAPAD